MRLCHLSQTQIINILSYRCINKGLMTIYIKVKFGNINLIWAYAHTEEKDDITKDMLFELLDKIYEQCPAHKLFEQKRREEHRILRKKRKSMGSVREGMRSGR